jgi:hypothetical protein
MAASGERADIGRCSLPKLADGDSCSCGTDGEEGLTIDPWTLPPALASATMTSSRALLGLGNAAAALLPPAGLALGRTAKPWLSRRLCTFSIDVLAALEKTTG